MFYLRQVHKESGQTTNFTLGESYSVSPNARVYFPDIRKEDEHRFVLVSGSNFCELLSPEMDYFIMTQGGSTFEKLFVPNTKEDIIKKSGLQSESEIVESIDMMCSQSLNPEVWDNWEAVKNHLNHTREHLKYNKVPQVFRVEKEMLENLHSALSLALTHKDFARSEDALQQFNELQRRIDIFFEDKNSH